MTQLLQITTVRSGDVLFRGREVPSRHPPADLAERAKTEIPAALAYQRHKLTPALRGDIVIKLTKLSVHFWQPERPKDHIRVILEDYVEDLAHIPGDILDETIQTWRRMGEWFPKVPHILAIAEPLLQKRRDGLHKLERLAKALDDGPPDEPPSKTEAEKARVSTLVKKTVARLKATSESPTPKSGGRTKRRQPPSEDDAAEHKRLYDILMAQMVGDGLLTDPAAAIEAEQDIDEGGKLD